MKVRCLLRDGRQIISLQNSGGVLTIFASRVSFPLKGSGAGERKGAKGQAVGDAAQFRIVYYLSGDVLCTQDLRKWTACAAVGRKR